MTKNTLKTAAKFVFVILMLIFTYAPILLLVFYSFTDAKVLGTWTGFSLKLYGDLFKDAEIMTAIANSLILAAVSSLLATFIGTVSAIGIFYTGGLKRKLYNFASQITMVNADIVTGVAFMLLFLMIRFIPYGWATLIIAHTVITLPYVIMSVLPRLSQLNPNLYEAGLDLGAGPVRTLFTVLLPQLLPGMIAGFALAFTLSLDDFVVTKFVYGDVTTISVYLYNNMKRGIKPVLKAMSSLIFVVVLAVLVVVNVASGRRNKRLKSL